MARKSADKQPTIVNDQAYYRVLKDILGIAKQYKLLNKNEERALIEKYKNDRPTLNDLLVKHNVRIIINMARKYIAKASSPSDLLLDGWRGLATAADRFDPSRNIKFNTYATPWVFKYLMCSFYSKSPLQGVNAVSLDQPIGDDTNNDLQSVTSVEDLSSTYLDRAGQGLASVENQPDGHCNMELTSNLISTMLNDLDSSNKLSEFDKAIINEHLIGKTAMAKLSAHYHVPYADAMSAKRKVIHNIKSVLASKYNIRSMTDLI